ncbi:MAG: hypothetical protein ACSW8H_09205 [bacterium]
MSFSGEVKRELANVLPEGRHCQVAELAAMITIAGARDGEKTKIDEKKDVLSILRTENEILQRKFFTLYQKAFMMREVMPFPQMEGGEDGRNSAKPEAFFQAIRHPMLLKRECCRRSFLRGAFLAAGSVSAPPRRDMKARAATMIMNEMSILLRLKCVPPVGAAGGMRPAHEK